jgi:hypothetical protein
MSSIEPKEKFDYIPKNLKSQLKRENRLDEWKQDQGV